MDFLEVRSLLKMSWTLRDDVPAATYSRLSSDASSHQSDSVMTTMASLWGAQALTATFPRECRVLRAGPEESRAARPGRTLLMHIH